jgi:sigma-B regulation protein RsbU (phosphoserine phosphatase)
LWFEPYASQRADGRIETSQIGSASHDYFQAEWFIKGLEDGGGYWSEPYYDDMGAKEILCSYVLPVRENHDGRVVGVFCADMSLKGLTERVKEFNLGAIRHKTFSSIDFVVGDIKPAYCFLLSRNGDYLVHPDPSRILHDNYFNHTDASGGYSYEEIGQNMLSGKTGSNSARVDGVSSQVFYAPLEHTGWSGAVVVSKASIATPGLALGLMILFFQMIGLIVTVLFFRWSIRRITRPIQCLVRSTEEVAKGNFDTQLPELSHYDEIHQLRDSFENMQHSLTTYINELTDATSKQAAMESELHIASDIQMSMLPKEFPHRDEMDIFGSVTPARTVGGDLYDFFIRDNRLFLCIGDVSGKGVPAAMVMSVTSSLFRTLAVSENSPAAIMGALNNSLATRNESLMFVTLFFGILDMNGHLTYCNAGHDAPLILEPDGSVRQLEADSNVVAGVIPDYTFTQQESRLAPGSTVFLFTDGLTEAENPNHELFGMDRTVDAAKAAVGSAPTDFVQKVSASVRTFVDGADQSDDLTMLVIQYKG